MIVTAARAMIAMIDATRLTSRPPGSTSAASRRMAAAAATSGSKDTETL
jgi:hypothetical protein